jgi:metal-responsive CopG/Arc/MetJ family transcriptional regulator
VDYTGKSTEHQGMKMADTDNSKVWVNTLMEKEIADKLDEMVSENGSTRAAFVRLLIENAYEERKHIKKILAKVKATS